nr:synaptobrevin, longin-like domain protein [Tanacetum cinerariifolium]
MVAYLSKSDASEGFNQIIDFLNRSSLKLQALIERKKVVVTEATIREALCLDDAEGVDCLPNEEIFAELARMGYKKPSTKLTFYKAFFSSQWKFLIHTILQCMSAKRTCWNEFSSSMASAVICLSSGRKFIFSKYILDSLMRNVDSTTKFYMYPHFLQLIIRNQVDEHVKEVNTGDAAKGDNSAAHGEVPTVAEEQSIPSPTPPTPPPQPPHDIPSTSQLKRRVKKLEKRNKVRVLKLRRLQKVETSKRVETSDDTMMDDESNQGRMIAEMDQDDVIVLKDNKEEDKEVADVVKEAKVETESAEVQEVVDVVTTAKLITKVVTATSEIITTAEAQVPAATTATLTTAPVRVAADPSRRKEPKPLMKKQQIEQDEQYARELHAELNKDIDWDEAIDYVKLKAKEDLANVAGFKLDYFKGMSYDDIRLIFEAKFNSNVAFLLKTKEQIEEDENRALQTFNETPAEKAAKRRKLDEEVPVVDYEIIEMNNKPYYKIIRDDGTHQLYISFPTLLRNFDREDLEALWSLVKERFSIAKPKNFSDDFLLTTLGAMFEKPDAHAQIWKNQRSVHGQAKVKSWKLLELCGV